MKPIIENIGVDLDLLNSELKLRSYKQRNLIIRKHAGGICTYCAGTPTKKLKYDVGDRDKLIEFYCDRCYQKHKSELNKRLENMNFG